MHKEPVDASYTYSADWLANARFEGNHACTAKDLAVMLMLIGIAVQTCEREKVLRDVPIRIDMRQFLGRTGIQSRAIVEAAIRRIEYVGVSGDPIFAGEPHIKDDKFCCAISKHAIKSASAEWSKFCEPVDVPIQSFLKMRCAQSIPVGMRAVAWLRSYSYARRRNENIESGVKLELPLKRMQEAMGFTFFNVTTARVSRIFDSMQDDLSRLSIYAYFEWRFRGRMAVALRVLFSEYQPDPRFKRPSYFIDTSPVVDPFETASPSAVEEPYVAPARPSADQSKLPPDFYREANRMLRGYEDIPRESWDLVDHGRPLAAFYRYVTPPQPRYATGPHKEANVARVPRQPWHTDAMWLDVDHDRVLERFSRHGFPMYEDDPVASEEDVAPDEWDFESPSVD